MRPNSGGKAPGLLTKEEMFSSYGNKLLFLTEPNLLKGCVEKFEVNCFIITVLT